MAPRYQAVQAAAMSRAVSAFSSATVIGPAATVRGRACGAAASRSCLSWAVAGLDGLPCQQRTAFGHGVAQLGGGVLECGVVEPLRQRFGAGAQAQQVTPAAYLVQSGGGHR